VKSSLRVVCVLLLTALTVLPSTVLSADLPPLQPEGREGLGPDRDYDIEHLRLDLAIDLEGQSVAGTATHRLRLLGRPTSELAFHQTALEVSSVRVADQDATFRLTDGWLFVTLPPAVGEQSEAFEVVISYTAKPTTGLHFRRPGRDSSDTYVEVWSQGEDVDNRHWFPTWDHPADRFDYEGVYTVDSKMTVVSNGSLVGRKDLSGGKSEWHYKLEGGDLVSYLVTLAVGPYERYEDSWQGREVSYFVPPGTGESETRLAVEETVPMLDFFSSVTGIEYPYTNYKQVFVQRFIYGGMENTTATTMSDGLLHAEEVHEESDDWTENVVAHELAHQWYGDQLTCAIWREMWLNEGFATFFAGLWMAKSRGEDYAAMSTLRTFGSVRSADKRGPRPLVTRFWNSETDKRANPYSKGSSVLQMLRVYLGDEVFFAAIKKYTRDNQNRGVETVDLRRAFEAVSGERLDWFFDQWVFLAGHPTLKVSHSVDAEASRLKVSIRQTQKVEGLVPTFILPIELEIATTEGTRIERVWLRDGEASIQLPLEGTLTWLGLDPRAGLLAKLEQKQSPDEWLAQLAGSEHPAARLRALSALQERKGEPTQAMRSALGALVLDTKASRAVRKQAAGVIGSWRDEGAADALIRLFQTESSGSTKLRDTAVSQLGKGLARKDVIRVLEGALKRDPSPYVRASALSALSQLLGSDVRSRALSSLRGSSYRDIVERKAASILGSRGTTGDLKALAPYRRPGVSRHLLHAALWASVRLAEKAAVGEARKSARKPVARDAERLLHDLNLRTRQTAVRILGSVGDSRSVEALRALAKRENFTPLAEAADSAIESIRKRDDKAYDPTPAEVEARLKKLEERVEAAEGELERLEGRR